MHRLMMSHGRFTLSVFTLLALLAPAAALAQTADGVRLYSGVTLLAEVASGAGTSTGEIAVGHLETEGPIDVVFLDSGVEFTPGGANETLGLSLADNSIATINSLGPWSFEITGDLEGMTDLTVTLLDNGVPTYTAPTIEVHVEEHFEVDGLRIRDGVTLLVEQTGGVTTGEIEAEHGQTTGALDITFLDDLGGEFTPDMDFTMVLEVADPLIATVAATGPWSFTATGVEEGITTVVVKVEHEGHIDFTSQPIEIHVEEHFEVEGLIVRRFGNVEVVQDEGVLTGNLNMLPGHTSDEHTITFFDHDGNEFTPEVDFVFQFDLGDPLIATVAQTGPWSFTFTGVAQGSTTFNIKVEHEGHFDFISEDIEIKIGDPTSAPIGNNSVFALRPAYPNPFAGATTVSFSLSQPERVKLVVYDVRGRQVDSLLDEQRGAGSHTVVWNPNRNAAGTYFLRLTSGGETATRKLIIQR